MAKLSVSREALKKAMDDVIATVHNSSTMAILKGVKFEVKDNVLAAYTNNTSAFSLSFLNVESDGNFDFVVEGMLFADLIRKLRTDEIELELKNNNLLVRAEGFETTLSLLSADEFPDAPVIQGVDIKVNTGCFVRSFNLTTLATSSDDARPILKCINLEIEGKKLSMAAVDGYRVSTTSFTLEEEGVNLVVNIPSSDLAKIIKNITEENINISIDIETKYFVIKAGTTIRGTKLAEGDFIDYRQILPNKEAATTVVGVEIDTLKNGLDLINVFKSEKPMVKFNIQESKLSLSSLTSKGKIEKDIDVLTTQGEDLSIAFNPIYFDVLGVLNSYSDKIMMHFTNSISPMIFEPTDSKLSFTYLLLPVRLPDINEDKKDKKDKKDNKDKKDKEE